MDAPTNEELHRRVSDIEDDVDALKNSVLKLEAVLPQLQTDITAVKESQIRSDMARQQQTEFLTTKLDDVKDKALTTVPTWASTTITILAMGVAALLTAFFTR